MNTKTTKQDHDDVLKLITNNKFTVDFTDANGNSVAPAYLIKSFEFGSTNRFSVEYWLPEDQDNFDRIIELADKKGLTFVTIQFFSKGDAIGGIEMQGVKYDSFCMEKLNVETETPLALKYTFKYASKHPVKKTGV